MNKSQVTLAITRGPLTGARHTFEDQETCVIGRAADCDIQLMLPNDTRFAEISRHHCQLDINPPALRVRDLGSRNGTWLNGERLSQGGAYLEHEEGRQPGDYVWLTDGDELRLGTTSIRVSVEATVPVDEPALALQAAGSPA